MKVLFQDTKKEDPYTRYFIQNLAYVVISRHINWRTIISVLSSEKIIIQQILLICVLSHFLITCIHLKLLFQLFGNTLIQSKTKYLRHDQFLFQTFGELFHCQE